MSRRLRLTAAVAPIALCLALFGCGSSGEKKASKPAVQHQQSKFEGAEATPPMPTPALDLRDSTGKRLNIADLRGKAVLVTFLYTHCPDVCPLITGNLHTAVKQLGPRAKKLQVVAVSTDPKGDTPRTVAKFLADHQMTGTMRYLIGSKKELGKTWKAWGIVARSDKANPEQVEHSAEIYGVSASGKVTTLYPANFKPAQIVHDVPLLEAQ